jgi:Holliday junction resolvasome RuvABC endonuclease subunit
MRICGIDPGLNGGIALYNEKMSVVDAIRTPVYQLKKGKQSTKIMDMYSICKILNKFDPDHIFIEQQQAFPKQGVISTFKTGVGYGMYLGLMSVSGYAHTIVPPKTWKKKLGVGADKDDARKRASELMPYARDLWQKKCEDGLAEAAMIAYYGVHESHVNVYLN